MTTNNTVNVGLSGATGTGNFVGANTPTLITPVLGAATGTSVNFGTAATNGLIGVTGTASASAGVVGEFVSSIVADSTTSLTSNTNADVTSISLTAGDWDLWGMTAFNGAGGTGVIINIGWISTTSATLPASNLAAYTFYSAAGTVLPYSVAAASFCVPGMRLSLSGTTTVYLSVRSAFITSTSTAGGAIYARRRR